MSKLTFNPMLTPSEMLNEGIFGGSYFGVEVLEGDTDYSILFKSFDNVEPSLYLGDRYKPKMNKFKIRSGLNYQQWQGYGWMNEDDPYGWFEWYTKYYSGRRHLDDDRQIRRWQDFCGINGRWKLNIYKKIHDSGNWDVSPRVAQSLLHWGYLINKPDYYHWCEMNNKTYKEEEWCEYGGLPSPKAYE